MTKKGEKFLTKAQVIKLVLDKVSVITADMIERFIGIGYVVFMLA